jgi:glycerol uptake facilitator-like aquaporin
MAFRMPAPAPQPSRRPEHTEALQDEDDEREDRDPLEQTVLRRGHRWPANHNVGNSGCNSTRRGNRTGLRARLVREATDDGEERGVAVLMRKALAEFIGIALLLIGVVGSGIAAQRLSPIDTGLALLENAVATGAALVAIILALGSVSGAHLNLVVSAADAFFGGLRPRELAAYVLAQVSGAAVVVIFANLMFSLPAVTVSMHERSTPGLWLGEVIATFGLLMVIFSVVRSDRTAAAPFAVGAYITGAYFLPRPPASPISRCDSGPHTL